MKFVILFYVVIVLLLALLFGTVGKNAVDQCEAKGGTELRTPGGTICARVEVIKP